MNSIGHRAVTVVTIVTLIYAPFFRNHHWVWSIVAILGESRRRILRLQPNRRCERSVNLFCTNLRISGDCKLRFADCVVSVRSNG